MDQSRREELLSAYLDKELSSDESALVESMLREDSSYRKLADELRSVRGKLASLPKISLSEDLRPHIWASTSHDNTANSLSTSLAPDNERRVGWTRPGNWVVWFAAAAATVAIMLWQPWNRVRHGDIASVHEPDVPAINDKGEGKPPGNAFQAAPKLHVVEPSAAMRYADSASDPPAAPENKLETDATVEFFAAESLPESLEDRSSSAMESERANAESAEFADNAASTSLAGNSNEMEPIVVVDMRVNSIPASEAALKTALANQAVTWDGDSDAGIEGANEAAEEEQWARQYLVVGANRRQIDMAVNELRGNRLVVNDLKVFRPGAWTEAPARYSQARGELQPEDMNRSRSVRLESAQDETGNLSGRGRQARRNAAEVRRAPVAEDEYVANGLDKSATTELGKLTPSNGQQSNGKLIRGSAALTNNAKAIPLYPTSDPRKQSLLVKPTEQLSMDAAQSRSRATPSAVPPDRNNEPLKEQALSGDQPLPALFYIQLEKKE